MLRRGWLGIPSWMRGLAVTVIAAGLSLPATAQTVLTASDPTSLISALNTIDSNPNTSYTLNFSQNITLTSATTLPAIISNSTVTINGGNTTLNGSGVQRGFFVYSGTVAINDLFLQNTVAQGGAGGSGGGGLGAGGAVFVASGANVTVSNVSVTNTQAIGGNGAASPFAVSSGGGGGLGGSGGSAGSANGGPGITGASGAGAGGGGLFANSGGTGAGGAKIPGLNGGPGSVGGGGGGRRLRRRRGCGRRLRGRRRKWF